MLAGSAVAGWCFVVGAARLRASARHALGFALRYLAESAFPIYVLHQPVVVVLGAGVVLLPLGIAAKFALLLTRLGRPSRSRSTTSGCVPSGRRDSCSA